MMLAINRVLEKVVDWLELVSGAALVFVTLLSGSDITGRLFGKPVPGAYEIISFAGGLVLGLAIPASVLRKVHVVVDLLVNVAPEGVKSFLHIFTRLLGIMLFVLMGYASLKMAGRLHANAEVTAVLELPFYPVAYAMGGAFFVTALLLIVELTKKRGDADA
jgi:TRAP-type C4-dicarboxylate transport system permease small subunit